MISLYDASSGKVELSWSAAMRAAVLRVPLVATCPPFRHQGRSTWPDPGLRLRHRHVDDRTPRETSRSDNNPLSAVNRLVGACRVSIVTHVHDVTCSQTSQDIC